MQISRINSYSTPIIANKNTTKITSLSLNKSYFIFKNNPIYNFKSRIVENVKIL